MLIFLTFTAGTLLALLASSLFFVDSAQKRPNKFLTLLLTLFSIHMFLLTMRFYEGRTDAYGLDSILATCLGPILYSYFVAVLKDQVFNPAYFLRHYFVVGLMVLIQFNDFGFELAKDIIILGSLTFYSAALLKVLSEERLPKSHQSDYAKRIFRFLMMLAVFMVILTVLDFMIFLEFTWLRKFDSHFALTAGTFILTAISLAATYVGLNRSQFISWIFAHKYTPLSMDGDFTSEEKQQAIQKLKILTENDCAHLNSDASVQSFSKKMGIPPRLLSQAVNQVHGKTFRWYINDLRIYAAKKLLETTDDTVLSIMFDVGFETKSNFNKEFFQSVGVSPNQYRKNIRS